MSSSTTHAPTRRHLSDRQAETVQRLVDTAHQVLREGGYDGLTVRNVASAAGVAPATAYTYFASKDHLVSEVFWRRLAALPPADFAPGEAAADRVAVSLAAVSLLLLDEPTVAAAVTTAMLASDPEVKRVRDRIGAALRQRLIDALAGDAGDADESVVQVLGLLFSGAMLQAGMGHLAYSDLPGCVAESARLVVGDRP